MAGYLFLAIFIYTISVPRSLERNYDGQICSQSTISSTEENSGNTVSNGNGLDSIEIIIITANSVIKQNSLLIILEAKGTFERRKTKVHQHGKSVASFSNCTEQHFQRSRQLCHFHQLRGVRCGFACLRLSL